MLNGIHVRSRLTGFSLVFVLSALSVPVAAQNDLSTADSPNSTKSIDSGYLPSAIPKFQGEINPNVGQSKSWWAPQVVPPKGAPNVLLIITDDVGFGAPSTFGGSIPTPTLDKLSRIGVKYNAFHSTALCSPSRAALITGRNHHSVHTGAVCEQATGFPGYNSIIGRDTASLGEILKQNGYATSWFGKQHNIPDWESSAAGPFDRWPVGLGFDYFYGFVGGDTSQWQPNLYRNTTPIAPYLGKPGWNLTTAMADDAISHLKQLNAISPAKPFFVYYAPGGTHAPHHAPPEWIAKFKGKFDYGWNVERENIFNRQKELGVIPADAKLTPWPDSLAKWDTLSADEKKLFARQAEVYAAYLNYTDYEIGRVVNAVEDMGKLNNTLIIYVSGDNGGSAEGSVVGTPNEVAMLNGMNAFSVKEQLKYYDAWGSDQTYNHMAVGWTWAFDTPFKWTKQVASHFGGTRQGAVIAWPEKIKDCGTLRSQFHHLVDVAPTVLSACGIAQPQMVNGVAQRPIEGVSMDYTWSKENSTAPSTHTTQYFEIMGNRAIYHDGWVACTTPPSTPWEMGMGKMPQDLVNGYSWELYNVKEEFSQSKDLAEKMPEKLREMQQLFLVEAAKYNVLPLDNSVVTRIAAPRPSQTAGRTLFQYSGEVANTPHGCAPNILGKSFTITADINVPAKGTADGVMVTQGGRFAGYSFFLKKGKPTFTYNVLDLDRVRWQSEKSLSPGNHTVVFDFKYDGGGFGKGGLGILKIDGEQVVSKRIERTVPFIFQWDESFDVGVDTGTSPDDKEYQVPCRLNVELRKLTLELKPASLTSSQSRLMEARSNRNNSASE